MKIKKSNMIPIDYEFMLSRIEEKGLKIREVATQLGWEGGYLNRDKVKNRGGLRAIDVKYLAVILECTEEELKAKPEPDPDPEIKETAHLTAASLTDEELIQELMRRLLGRK